MFFIDWLIRISKHTSPYNVTKDPFAILGFGLLVFTIIIFMLLLCFTARRSAHSVFDSIRNGAQIRRLQKSSIAPGNTESFINARRSEERAGQLIKPRQSIDMADLGQSGHPEEEAVPLVAPILKTKHTRRQHSPWRPLRKGRDLGKEVRFSSLVEEYSVILSTDLDGSSEPRIEPERTNPNPGPSDRRSMSERQLAELYL